MAMKDKQAIQDQDQQKESYQPLKHIAQLAQLKTIN